MKKFKLFKSLTAIALTLCVGYFAPLSAFASFDIRNDDYNGVYVNPAKSNSYISAQESGCSISIVYSDLENQFLTSSNGAGYISNRRFYAEFSYYIITKSDGTIVKRVNQETYLSGTVSVDSNRKYIKTSNRYYYKDE